MNITPSSELVKKSLNSHAWIGIGIGGLMYLICLTGTIAVFYPQLERWEQPLVQEYETFDPMVIESVYNRVAGQKLAFNSHMNIALPTKDLPRAAISNEETGWFINSDGSLGEQTSHKWTHLLTDLHIYLHLPNTLGILIVSFLGIMLCTLIVTGLMSHPKIFKDAFSLRLSRGDGSDNQLEQVDIHNRLSVWGAPFYLIIAFTGAYFGIVIPIMSLYAYATDQVPETLVAEVFGDDPKVNRAPGDLKIAKALEQMQDLAPEGEVFYLTVHDANTEHQFMEVRATLPGRLIYSESYRFDADGEFLGNSHFADGEVGKQIAYSMYRIHFGHFGGVPMLFIYALLGLALTVISVTGVNIWLIKRKERDYLDMLWAGLVWGAPLALTVTATTQLILGIPSSFIFWGTMAASCFIAYRIKNTATAKQRLLQAWLLSLVILLFAYAAQFGAATFNPAALPISLFIMASIMILLTYTSRRAIQNQQLPNLEQGDSA